jgi:putative oxidoreductase
LLTIYYIMKPSLLQPILMIISRMLLGGIMLVGGIMQFIVNPIDLYNDELIAAIFKSRYLWELIGAIEIFCGIGILLRRYMPILLVILAPVSVMIFNFHLSQIGRFGSQSHGITLGITIIITHLYLAWCYRNYYKALFTPRDELNNLSKN